MRVQERFAIIRCNGFQAGTFGSVGRIQVNRVQLFQIQITAEEQTSMTFMLLQQGQFSGFIYLVQGNGDFSR